MRTKLFFFASLSLGLLVASCQSDLEDEMVNLVEETNAVTRADDFGSVASIKQLDTVDLLKTYIEKVKLSGVKNESKDKQSKPSYTLTPYIYEGDTVMYVAQYEDGWELLSTDERIPLVLASTESGVFDLKRIPEAMKDYINSTAERVSVLKKTAEIESEQNSEWAVIHRKNKKATTRSIYDPHPELGTGYWELISTSLPTIISVDSIDHLVTTHWTQEDPFNAYTPKYLNLQGIYNNSLLGCSPVAVGQFLYYYYEKDGTLFNIPQTATYNSLLNSYSYSDFSYYAMNQLAKVKSDSNLGKSRTSVFLSYLGYLMNTSYSLGAGTTTTQDMLNTLNDFMTPIFSEYDIDESYIISSIQSGYPVLAKAYENANNTGGHAFLIDKYKNTTTERTYYYGWVGTDCYGNPTNEYDELGHVLGFTYLDEDNVQNTTTTISMNWGASVDGLYYNYWQRFDNLEFRVTDIDWIVSTTSTTPNYKYNRKIYH